MHAHKASRPIHQLTFVGVDLLWAEYQSTDFDFCLDAVGSTDVEVGYFEDRDMTWGGYASAVGTGGATFQDNTRRQEYGPFCMDGRVPTDPTGNASARMSFNLNQPRGGGASQTIVPTGDGINVEIYNTQGDYILYALLISEDGQSSWCADVTDLGVNQFIAWSSFNTDCAGTGTAYTGQAIRTLTIHAPSLPDRDNLVNFCFHDAPFVAAP